MIHGHGDDRENFGKPIVADFSSNVWFGSTDPDLIAHLKQNMQLIGNYPEPDAAVLCRKISEKHRVNSAQVLAFNGSVEAFYTIALAFRNSVSSIRYPAFAEYEDACHMHAHQLRFFLKEDLETTLETKPELLWIGNPNNPDGSIFAFQEIKAALEKYTETVFVIDEAYAGFYPEFQSAIELTTSYPNLIVVRSMTKCCAIPGLRLGYLVASPPLADKIRQFQQPWSVNALAQEAGLFLLNSGIEPDVNQISGLSVDLQKQINAIGGFRVITSHVPFFLIEMSSGTAAELKLFLLEERGILIRDASNFRGLNDRFFRVCTRNEHDNQLLLNGIKSFSENYNQL